MLYNNLYECMRVLCYCISMTLYFTGLSDGFMHAFTTLRIMTTITTPYYICTMDLTNTNSNIIIEYRNFSFPKMTKHHKSIYLINECVIDIKLL